VSELLFLKSQQGLVPASEAAVEWLRRKKLGSTILVDAREMRNGAFFRKFWALLNLGYDYWSDAVEPLEHKGEPVLPEFDRFRKDVTILAGFYHSVVNIKGEVRIEADSLKWSSMTEETFTQLYDATIRVMLRKVFNGQVCPTWSEEQLRSVAEQILQFSAL
jgi:Protein of unknown function (DUF1367)